MLQHPQFTLSILDPASLVGNEVAASLRVAFPAVRRRFFHTSGDDEHQVTEVRGEPAMVPPLGDATELEGSDVVIATASPAPAAAAVLTSWLRANPGTVLIDCTQPGLAPTESVPVLATLPPGRSERRWFQLADPSLWGPGRWLDAIAPLRPQQASLTVLLPASTFGEAGVEELARQAAARLSGRPPQSPAALPAVLAFDAAPADATRRDALERQVRILFPNLVCRLAALETGIFHGNAASVQVYCDEAPDAGKIATLLRRQPGIRLARRNERPQPSRIVGTDEVVCAEVQCSGSWVTAWLLADGLRLGGAAAVADILAAVRAS